MCSLWKLKKGSWINVECIVISWCFVLWCLIQRKNLLISPAKLFNLGMTNDCHIHLKFFPKGLYTDSITNNIKNALSEESDIVASFSPILSLSDPLCGHWLPLSRRKKNPGVGKGVERPEAFLAQKPNPSNQLSIQKILTFALHLCTK